MLPDTFSPDQGVTEENWAAKLRSLPTIPELFIFQPADQVRRGETYGPEPVETRLIVNFDTGLTDASLAPAFYQKHFATGIAKGEIGLSALDGAEVEEIGGLYQQRGDGRHRVAVAKVLDVPALTCDVRHIKFSQVEATSIDELSELERRRQQGLWTGQKISETRKWGHTITTWRVTAVEGPWAFAADPEAAREVYLALRPDLYYQSNEGIKPRYDPAELIA